jgi:hypothetical protein
MAATNPLLTKGGDPFDESDLFQDVLAYARLGMHRTATAVDHATSDWIAGRLRGLGYDTRLPPFTIRQFFTREAWLEAMGHRFACVPQWLPHPIGPAPVRAPLVVLDHPGNADGLHGKVALGRFPWFQVPDAVHRRAALIRAAAVNGARALVAITEGPSDEIYLHGALSQSEPLPLPVLLVAPRDSEALVTAATWHEEVTLCLDGEDRPAAEAFNVVATLRRGPTLLVVSTPQSGWFRCAGERGPGVAIFLALARWAVEEGGDASFLFVSTSGHERAAAGQHAFLTDGAPSPAAVRCWLHLGASIATRTWEDPLPENGGTDAGGYPLRCSPALLPLLIDTFATVPGVLVSDQPAQGELARILRKGYTAFGLYGIHRFFHTPADGPETVNPALLRDVARATASALAALV